MLQKCKLIGFQKMDGMTLFICYDEGYILSSQVFTNVLRKWCWRLDELHLQKTRTKKRKKETAGERHRDCWIQVVFDQHGGIVFVYRMWIMDIGLVGNQLEKQGKILMLEGERGGNVNAILNIIVNSEMIY